jgi:predicted permease
VLLLQVFAQVLLPIFVMIAIGWVLDRRFNLDLNTLVKLNISLFVPAFVFVRIVESDVSGGMAARVIVFTITMIASMFLLGALIGRLNGYGIKETRALQIAAMFYNSGNYGIPLMTLAYPVLGPVLQVFVILVQNLSNFTIGLFLVAPAGESRTRRLFYTLRQVSVWAVALGVLSRQLGIPVRAWPWLWVPLQYLAAGLVGVALVTLGAQLSKTSHNQPWRRLSWALGLRLAVGPAVAFALVPVFGFHGEAAAVMVLSSSFPTAVNTALIAHEFKADAHFAAAAVFYSTLLSVITVTVLIALLRVVYPG